MAAERMETYTAVDVEYLRMLLSRGPSNLCKCGRPMVIIFAATGVRAETQGAKPEAQGWYFCRECKVWCCTGLEEQ